VFVKEQKAKQTKSAYMMKKNYIKKHENIKIHTHIHTYIHTYKQTKILCNFKVAGILNIHLFLFCIRVKKRDYSISDGLRTEIKILHSGNEM